MSVGNHPNKPRPLFGGALSAALPPNATDVSDLRDIPDNQEVFAHKHTDQSIVVELLEYQSHVPDRDAARFHFEDVAGSNGALEPGAFHVTHVSALPKTELSLSQCGSGWFLTGSQSVSKFNEEARNSVSIHLGLFRLPQFSTDILVTFNDPQSVSADSSSAAAAQTHRDAWTAQDFHALLQSLALHDSGLFG